MRGLIGNGEIFGGRMESGLMGSGLARNKPSENVFEPVVYSFDPYVNNIVLYLKGDSLTDSSKNNLTITNNTNVTIVSDQFKYGSSSLYFDGSNVLSIESPLISSIGSGDYTIEGWVRWHTAVAVNKGLWSFSSTIEGTTLLRAGGNDLNVYLNDLRSYSTQIINFSSYLNTWVHLALVRKSGVSKVYINGIKTGNDISNTRNLNSYPVVFIGSYYSLTGYRATMYLSNFRLTSLARYTSNFDPETDTYLAY